MASIVYFLDNKGRPLLSRDYKGDIPHTAVEQFPLLLLKNSISINSDDNGESPGNGGTTTNDDSGSVPPVLFHNGINYIFLIHKNLYILALTKYDTNIFSIMNYLNYLIEVIESYVKSLEEESIRDNFSIIYELLDEMMDFGIPQITDQKILKEYITQRGFSLESVLNVPATTTSRMPPSTLTNSISWRSPGIMYKKNEAYLDVIESIDMLVNAKGQMLSSEIKGNIRVKSFLSGMPELQLGLNEKFLNSGLASIRGEELPKLANGIEVEDVKFHQCVRLSRFESDKQISFIPPDGEFNLLTYRVHSNNLRPLFLVDYKYKNHSGTRLEIMVKLKANFRNKIVANKLELKVPVPEDVDSPKFHYNKGSIKYLPNDSEILWKFKRIEGGKEYVMIAELMLPSVNNTYNLETFMKKPLSLKFEMQGFVTSGLQVKYLKINEPKMNYQSYPYVRYITKSGDNYSIRVK